MIHEIFLRMVIEDFSVFKQWLLWISQLTDFICTTYKLIQTEWRSRKILLCTNFGTHECSKKLSIALCLLCYCYTKNWNHIQEPANRNRVQQCFYAVRTKTSFFVMNVYQISPRCLIGRWNHMFPMFCKFLI